MKGEIPLLEKAKALQAEVMMYMPEDPGDEPLGKGKVFSGKWEENSLITAGLAIQKVRGYL